MFPVFSSDLRHVLFHLGTFLKFAVDSVPDNGTFGKEWKPLERGSSFSQNSNALHGRAQLSESSTFRVELSEIPSCTGRRGPVCNDLTCSAISDFENGEVLPVSPSCLRLIILRKRKPIVWPSGS